MPIIAPILATIGNQISTALHHIIFAFPSPDNSTDDASHSVPDRREEGFSSLSGFEQAMSEPGEPRALAGGIGPLSFAGSGYGVTLVLMAILLNRIHNIVRRPRPPAPPLPHPPVQSYYYRARIAVSRALTSPSAPQYIRLPGILLLLRAWILFGVLTLQVAGFWPLEMPSYIPSPFAKLIACFGSWAGGKTMETVCWQVFVSVCVGLTCSGLANGLDRTRRRDVGAGFNLFGYSFLLHLYSSPLTHHRPPPAANHGRPDIHALFQLFLSLTELTWLQTIELSSELRRNQLLPTGVCGGLGLAHFVYALSTSPLKFPSFTFLTHLMALFLSIVIIFSVVLKGFTNLFTFGYLPSPILQNLLPHDGVLPSIEDDFGVVLLKLGTACIESTQYSGLSNELAGIEERQGPWVQLDIRGSDVYKPNYHIPGGGFGMEITDIDVAELDDPNDQRPRQQAMKEFGKACWGFVVAITVGVVMGSRFGRWIVGGVRDLWGRRWWFGPRQWRFWRREAWVEPARFGVRRAERTVRRQDAGVVRATGRESVERDTRRRMRSMTATPTPGEVDGGSTYLRYLSGQGQIEDDEVDWEDETEGGSTSSDAESDAEEERDLYRDLMVPNETDPGSGSSLQPVLLAHLTSGSTGPLTRTRYNAILASPARGDIGAGGMVDVIADRRAVASAPRRDDWDEERRRCCVVCTVEARDTILWPCRCLALCNECRENLAARLPAKDHMCPCCRRKVDGYSRIFVP